VRIDRREGHSPGFKFNDWEMRGVPLRIELGPRDVANNEIVLARRDIPGREGKQSAPRGAVAATVGQLLETIQQNLYDRALRKREERTASPTSYADLGDAVENGFARVWWCEQADCEDAIKADTGATSRCIPIEQEPGSGVCIRDGRPASRQAIFARAY
jgi:prolyl-tRNA synthetase